MRKDENLFKIAVVRGPHPRMTEANFYGHFRWFKVKLIGDEKTGWIVKEKLPQSVEFIHSPLRPVWGFDPWTAFFGPLHVHRSFQFVSNLEKHVADCEIINVSDLFYFYCWQSAQIAQQQNKKLVAIVWENIPYHPSTYVPPYCFGVRTVLKTTDLFVARSKKARQYLLSIGAEEKKIKVVYKGIDLSVFKNRPRKKDGKVKILYVGQLVKSKGVSELLAAFARLCREFDHLELMLLGRSKGDPLERKIKNLATRVPITLRSQVDYDKVPAIYQQADIYCHLSQDWKYLGLIKGGNDWFPYAILEAMASGLPIVATKVGGIPEQLGQEGNIYVEQKDVETVYQGLKRFILDDELRRSVGGRNRKRAEKMFDIEKQARETEEAILGLLKS